MSDNLLFNWGGRGPEWEAIQRKLEMDAAQMETLRPYKQTTR